MPIVRVADHKAKGSVASRWVLVVDADSMLSLRCSEYEPEKDWLCESNDETAMENPVETSNGGRDIAMQHYENRNPWWASNEELKFQVKRRGAWVKVENYWPYPTNSPLHEQHAEGCNSDTETDSESKEEPDNQSEDEPDSHPGGDGNSVMGLRSSASNCCRKGQMDLRSIDQCSGISVVIQIWLLYRHSLI